MRENGGRTGFAASHETHNYIQLQHDFAPGKTNTPANHPHPHATLLRRPPRQTLRLARRPRPQSQFLSRPSQDRMQGSLLLLLPPRTGRRPMGKYLPPKLQSQRPHPKLRRHSSPQKRGRNQPHGAAPPGSDGRSGSRVRLRERGPRFPAGDLQESALPKEGTDLDVGTQRPLALHIRDRRSGLPADGQRRRNQVSAAASPQFPR